MIKSKQLAALAAVMGVAAGLMSAPAAALPSGGGTCNVQDVWSGPNLAPAPGTDYANDCVGLYSNAGPTGTNITTVNYATLLSSWTPFDTGTWTTVTDLAAGGSWTLNYAGDIIIALKQGNQWGAWFLAAPNHDSGGYTTINFVGAGTALSHGFALTGTPTTRVPEPATLGLLGLGLLGAGLARRRRA